MSPRSPRKSYRRAKPFSLGLESLEDRSVPAATSFAGGVLTIDLNAVNEAVNVTTSGSNIVLTGSTFTGDGDTFLTANVGRIVFADSGANESGQSIAFTNALTLSQGLSGTGVESVFFDAPITAGSAASIDVIAGQSVEVFADVTGGSGGVTLVGQGTAALDTIGVLIAATVTTINDGAVVVTGFGGSGAAGDNFGVLVDAGQITSGGTGTVTVTGTGGAGTGSDNYGVALFNAGQISSGGAGTVTVFGTGGSGANGDNYGVWVVNTGSTITSGGGTVEVSGQGGGGTGSGNTNYGVVIEDGRITAGGAGNVSVSGTGGTGSGSDNYGVWVANVAAEITSNSGNVEVVGQGGGGAGAGGSNFGVVVDFGQITSGGGTVIVDGTGGSSTGGTNVGVLVAGGTVTSGGGNVDVTGKAGNGTQFNAGVQVDAGGAISAAGATSTVTVTGTGGGGTTNNDGVFVSGSTITSAGGNVRVTGTGGLGTNQNFGVRVNGGGTITSGGSGTVTVEGTGKGTGTFNIGVFVTAGATITSTGGDVEVSGTGAAGTDSNFGVRVLGATTQITADGLGKVSVAGTGGAGSGTNNFGVDNSGVITSAGGDVLVRGFGGTGTLNARGVNNGGEISSGGDGNLTVEGTGGATGGAAVGVSLSGPIIAGGTGTVSVTGTGGGTLGNGDGINFSSSTARIASILGNVIVRGTGSAGGGVGNQGIRFLLGQIDSNGTGNITITGTGGQSGDGSVGIDISGIGTTPTRIEALGTGSVTIDGFGGSGSGNGGGWGLFFRDSKHLITSNGGDVTINGTGGTGGPGDTLLNANHGILALVGDAANVESGGNGNIRITGTAGDSGGGVLVNTANFIPGGTGTLSVTGTGSAGFEGISFLSSSVVGNGSTAVTLTADSLLIDATSTVDAGTAMVHIRPVSLGTNIDLGGADVLAGSPLTLGLTDAELNRITAGTLLIGSGIAGAIEVSTDVSPANIDVLSLATAADVGGTGVITADALAVRAETGIALSGPHAIPAVTLFNLTSGGISFTSAQSFSIEYLDFLGGVTAAGQAVSLTATAGTIAVNEPVSATGVGGSVEILAGRSVDVTANVTGGSGGVSITGSGTLAQNTTGVRIFSGNVVTATDSGDVALTGTGGGGTANGRAGVAIGGTVSTSGGGNLTVTGTGGSGSSGTNNSGVIVANGTLQASGSGTITVTGSASGTTNNNHGVTVVGGRIEAAAGDIEITGTGGNGTSNNEGIQIVGNGLVTTTGAGSIALTGTAGNSTASYGILLISSSGVAAEGTGSVRLEGTGTVSSEAILITSTSFVTTAVNDIEIVADSLFVDSTSEIESPAGIVTIRPLTAGTLINLGGGDLLSGPPLTLGLTSDEINRVTAAALVIGDAAAGNITVTDEIAPTGTSTLSLVTSGAVIDGNATGNDLTVANLGITAPDGSGAFGDPIELSVDTLTTNSTGGIGEQYLAEADTLTVAAGDLTADTGVFLAGGTFLTAVGGDIFSTVVVQTGATLGGVGTTGDLLAASGGTLAPGNSPGILFTGDLDLAAGSTFAVEVNGATPGTQHDQVIVTGTVNVTGAILSASGTIASTVGQEIVLVANDDSEPIVGTFAGLPEGATVTINGLTFVISYEGGDGNDIALTQAESGSLVVTTLDDVVDPLDGLNSLREAVAFAGSVAATNPTVTFAVSGTIVLGGTEIALTAATGTLTIDGDGRIVLDANELSRILSVGGGIGLVLDGLTFTGGDAGAGSGGAVSYGGPLLRILDSTFEGNAAVAGGAVNVSQNDNATIAIVRSRFLGNSAENFGAFAAIQRDDSTFSIVDSEFSNNSATDSAGALNLIQRDRSALLVERSLFDANEADAFSGINLLQGIDSTFDVTSSTFANHSGGSNGGAITYLAGAGSVGTVRGSTFVDNAAATGAVLSGPTLLEVQGSLFARNETVTAIVSLGNNLLDDAAAGTGFTAPTDLVDVAPLLAPLGNYGGPTRTFALLPGSPAIDAGAGTAVDQRGIASVGTRDIGAFESRGITLAIVGGNNQTALAGNAFPVPLTVEVTSPFGEPVAGGIVSFNAPVTGPSTIPVSSTASIDGTGLASVSRASNGTVGTFAVAATAPGATAANFSLTSGTSPTIDPPTVPPGTTGTPYTIAISTTGFPAPTFSATGLPPGLVVDPATGTISGTPTQAGDFPVVVTATNELGSASTTFTIPIAAALVRFPAFSAGSGAGIPAEIRLYNSDGSLAQTLQPFGDFSGGVAVATGDLDGDGVNDTVAGAGAGGGPRVVVLSGATGAVLADFFAYESSFRGGVWVAVGDVDGDGTNEIVVGAGVGGGPRVRVLKLDGSVVTDFFTADSDLRFGVTVAVDGLTGDGIDDIVTGVGREISIFAGGDFSLFSQFDTGLAAPISVAAAGGTIYAGSGFGDSAQIRTFSANGETVNTQSVFEDSFTGGARIAATDLDSNGIVELVVGAGVGGGPRVQVLGTPLDFFAFEPALRGGVFVG